MSTPRAPRKGRLTFTAKLNTPGSRAAIRSAQRSAIRQANKKKQKVATSVIPTQIVSDRTFVKLNYIDVDTPYLGTIGFPQSYNKYKLNSVWDFNNAIATTAIPGQTEWANFYQQYRVHYVQFKVDICNATQPVAPTISVQKVIPSVVGLWFQPNNANTPAAWQDFMHLDAHPYGRQKLISSWPGDNKCTLKFGMPLWKLYGNKQQYLSDDNFAASTNNNPVNILYAYIYALTADGSPFPITNGINIRLRAKIYVEFYQRKTFST